MAMAGLSLAVARGVSVPGDLSVTGFDDIEIAAHLQPVADHGRAPTSSPGAGRRDPAARS